MELYTDKSITESHVWIVYTTITTTILIKHGKTTDTLHGCYINVCYTLS